MLANLFCHFFPDDAVNGFFRRSPCIWTRVFSPKSSVSAKEEVLPVKFAIVIDHTLQGDSERWIFRGGRSCQQLLGSYRRSVRLNSVVFFTLARVGPLARVRVYLRSFVH